MASDVMSNVSQDTKKNRFSALGSSFSDDDILRIWESVANFIEKNMQSQKGVNIPNFGSFTFVQNKLDVGGNKFVLIQRPVFQIGEKFCQTHALKQTKYFLTGAIPVVPLNFSALAMETPYTRDQVESCVREMIGALNRSVAAQKTVEIVFTGLGRLQIRDSTVKFKFYKEFVNAMDQTGRAMNAMQNRPGTADSVMSDRPASRAFSVCLPLPKIGDGSGCNLAPIPEDEALGMDFGKGGNYDVHNELAHLRADEDGLGMTERSELDGKPTSRSGASSRSGSRLSAPVAMATDVNLGDLALMTSSRLQQQQQHHHHQQQNQPSFTGPMTLQQYDDIYLADHRADEEERTPPPECNHAVDPSGHVHQDAASSDGDPPSAHQLHPLDVELKRLEERLAAEECGGSACGGGVGALDPATLNYLDGRPSSTSQHSASGGRSAPLTPPKPPSLPSRAASSCGHPSTAGQELCYLCHQRRVRNQPVSFAEEIARQEEEEDRLLQAYQQMRDTEQIVHEQENLLAKRHDSQKISAFNMGVSEAVRHKRNYRDPNYYRSYIFQQRALTPPRIYKQKELSSELGRQMDEKKSTKDKLKADEAFLERLEQVQLAEDLAAQRDQFIRERADQQEMYRRALNTQLRYKPVPLPERVPLDPEPVFGKNDVNEAKLLEKRRRAQEIMEEQAELAAQKKREVILARLQEQKHEEEVLKRAKEDLLKDRASRYRRHYDNRRRLEQDWMSAAQEKKEMELMDRLRGSTPGGLIHEQCDRYKRCDQCRRKLNNAGETNLWCESYYVPGSRYIC